MYIRYTSTSMTGHTNTCSPLLCKTFKLLRLIFKDSEEEIIQKYTFLFCSSWYFTYPALIFKMLDHFHAQKIWHFQHFTKNWVLSVETTSWNSKKRAKIGQFTLNFPVTRQAIFLWTWPLFPECIKKLWTKIKYVKRVWAWSPGEIRQASQCCQNSQDPVAEAAIGTGALWTALVS